MGMASMNWKVHVAVLLTFQLVEGGQKGIGSLANDGHLP